MIDLHTFSIAARDPQRGEFGVAVSTARPNVGSLVPHVSGVKNAKALTVGITGM